MKIKSVQHYARIEKSPRLKRFFDYMVISNGSPRTGLEIFLNTRILDARTAKSELRHQGINIQCKHRNTTSDGSRIFAYWLNPKQPKIEGAKNVKSFT